MSKLIIPLESYRFRILPLGVGHDAAQIFSKMVNQSKLDLAEKTLTITAIQDHQACNFETVGLVVGEAHTVIVDYLTRNSMIAFSLELTVNTISHSLEMDYGSTKALAHRMVVSFENVKTLPGELAPMGSSTGADLLTVSVPEGEFITPQQACDLMDQSSTEKVDPVEDESVDDTDVER